MLWRAKTNYKSIHVGLKKCWNWILRPDVTSWKWLAVNIKSVPSIGFISSVARIRGQSDRVWLKCIWLELHKGEFRLSRTQSNCRVQQGSLTPQTGYLFQGKAIGRCSCCSSVITVEICSQQSYWSEISKCMVVCDDFNPQIDSSEAVLWYFHALRGTDGHSWAIIVGTLTTIECVSKFYVIFDIVGDNVCHFWLGKDSVVNNVLIS